MENFWNTMQKKFAKNSLLLPKASAEKFPGGDRQKDLDREIAPISLPPFHQWRVIGCTGQASRAHHLKGTMHLELHVKR